MQTLGVLDKFDSLGVWSRGDQRAPHKPLLVLFGLARWQRGQKEDIPYREVDSALTPLLKEFGPPRQAFHSEYPFRRLQNDGVWIVRADGPMVTRSSNTDPLKSELLAKNARGGFTEGVKFALQKEPGAISSIARRLLEQHFPESLHGDILGALDFL